MGSWGRSLSGSLSGGQGEVGDGGYPQVRGHGKAFQTTLILGRSPAREDGGVDPFTGENTWTEFPHLIPPVFFFPFALLKLGSCRPCKRHCLPGGAGKERREPGGRDTRLGSLHPLLPRHCGSPNWRGTGFSRARSWRLLQAPGGPRPGRAFPTLHVQGNAWMAEKKFIWRVLLGNLANYWTHLLSECLFSWWNDGMYVKLLWDR